MTRASAAWLLLLNVLLQLPWALHGRFDPLLLMVPAGELVALVAVVSWWPRLGGRLLALSWLVLMLIEIDRLVGVFLMDQDPLFYDQLFLMRHLAVLITDLWTPWWTAGALVIVATLSLTIWVLRRAVDSVRSLSGQPHAMHVLIAVLTLTMLPESLRPVRWISPELAKNIRRSLEVWDGVRHASDVSPYEPFVSVQLERLPDLQMFIIESYGRIMATSDMTQDDWLARMNSIEADLSSAGWHTASAWCTAPVSGGRSWLADGSLLTGMPIRYESVYRHLLKRVEPLPDLVEFFDRQGYRTIRVAPKDRARPGISLTNDFHFGQQVTFQDFDYDGPALGWGWIPDQYSLGYVDENILDGGPLFMLFHMVSSHIPWDEPPPILNEWRALELLDGDTPSDTIDLPKQTYLQLRRYKRTKRVHLRRVKDDVLTMYGYAGAIDYELEILRRHLLSTAPRDAIVIIMGDHQPPLVGRSASMDVPMHVLAQDPALLAELYDQGFTPGLAIAPDAPTALRHEGFFSLMVRALARCCGPPTDPLPTYRPTGTPPHP